MKRFARYVLTLLLILTALAGVAYVYYQHALKQPVALSASRLLEIERGDNLWQLAQRLHAEGVLPEPYSLTAYALQQRLHTRIQAGTYELRPNMTIPQLLQQWSSGDVAAYTFTLVEGKTVAELLSGVNALPPFAQQNALTPEQLAHALQLPVDGLEGWFKPETYRFTHGSSALDLLKRMHKAQQQTLAQAWEKRAPDLPLQSAYQALILASLIEKETGVAQERAEIAGVFVRRLQRDMLLQTDPSVIYGAQLQGQYHGKLTKALLREDHPYNTYTRKGLPPTPIANPSVASIEAALHPAVGKTLFFMAKREGGHTFSETYEQHQQAVKAYYQHAQ